MKRNDQKTERWKGVWWRNVKPEEIISFLEEYNTHPQAYRANSQMIREFIECMISEQQELTDWTVAVLGGSVDDNREIFEGGFEVKRSKRTAKIETAKATPSGGFLILRMRESTSRMISGIRHSWRPGGFWEENLKT